MIPFVPASIVYLMASYALLALIAPASGARLRGSSHGGWPPTNQIYTDPLSPPHFMLPSTVDPTLPLSAPPPVPLSIAPLPSPLSDLPLYYYSPAAPDVTGNDRGMPLWPPAPPRGNPAYLPGNAAMRPLSLLDAHGAEYMKDAKKSSRRKDSAEATPSDGLRASRAPRVPRF